METLEERFHGWLLRIADRAERPVEVVTSILGRREIQNRFAEYPVVHNQLSSGDTDWPTVFSHMRKAWPLSGRFDAIKLNEFVGREEAVSVLSALISDAADDPVSAVDQFVDRAVTMGYFNSSQNRADRSSATLLASVVLTCARPRTLVDYRQARWKHLASELDYDTPGSTESAGDWVVWAGRFAAEIRKLDLFRKHWGGYGPELWTVAGICWDAREAEFSELFSPDSETLISYTEGQRKMRLHLSRERSSSLVRKVKEGRMTSDPGLHCDACGLSYLDVYGERGRGFIEAHHKVPLSKLRPGTRTKAEDLALLCANCHRMIHTDPMVSVGDLREVLAERTTLTADGDAS